MFEILNLNHTIHLVEDLDALDQWYEDVFGARRRSQRGYLASEKRDASSFGFSDYSVETMAPAKEEGADKLPVGRFLIRFGQRFYSMGLYVKDIPGFHQALRDNNIRIVGNAGRSLEDVSINTTLYTHPLDTYSLWEVSDPTASAPFNRDLRLQGKWSADYWRNEHPLGIERTSHYTVVVKDLAKPKGLYQDILGCKLIYEGENEANKTRSAYFLVGRDSVVELAMPTTSDSLAAWDVETNGEFMHAVTFKVKDIDRAESHIKSKNIRIENRQKDSFVLNRDDALGAVYAFTQATIPNDPRSKEAQLSAWVV